jgi:hypothetical protein
VRRPRRACRSLSLRRLAMSISAAATSRTSQPGHLSRCECFAKCSAFHSLHDPRCEAEGDRHGNRFSGLIVTAAIAIAASAAISVPVTRTSAQALAGSGVKTAWGEPDLQGIWTEEGETPLQRPAKYATRNSSPRRNGLSWTRCDRGYSPGAQMSATPTTAIMARCSFPRSAPARVRRRLPIRPTAGSLL